MSNKHEKMEGLYARLRSNTDTYLRFKSVLTGESHSLSKEQLIRPSGDAEKLLIQQTIDMRDLSDLVVFDDVVNVLALRKGGFVLAKRDGWDIYGAQYDFVTSHLPYEKNIPGFYNIPIINSNSDHPRAIMTLVFNQFCRTGNRRYFVNSPRVNEPSLLDVNVDSEPTILFRPYLRASFSEIVGDSFEEDKAKIENIRNKVWGQATNNACLEE